MKNETLYTAAFIALLIVILLSAIFATPWSLLLLLFVNFKLPKSTTRKGAK